MSSLLQISNLKFSQGLKLLFDDLDFSISDGDRIAVVGHNGSGKTTLLDLVSGIHEADSGSISLRKQLRISRVEQFVTASLAQQTLLDAVSSKLDDAAEGWRAESMLQQLGFSSAQFDIPVADLSGGQQNKLMFARAVVCEPELLLLDEPTNHLDLETLLVFETFLAAFSAAFILVSHDREFLDRVCNHTCILRDQRLYRFDLPYSEACAALEQMDAAAIRTREQQEKKIDSLQASAKRLATWGQVYDNEGLSKRAKSMEKRIEKMQAQKVFVSKGTGLDLKVDLAGSRSRQLLRVENFEVCIPKINKPLFETGDFLIRPGDRIALLGNNGVGKSSFIKQLVTTFRNKIANESIRFSPQMVLGYYDQELDEVSDRSSIEQFVSQRVEQNDQEISRALITAGFKFADHDKPVDTLSGGERARILFVVLSLQKPNFLILDEPTNHVDIEGKQQLEGQLKNSSAAILMTSHDRRFISNVAERYVWIHQSKLTEISSPDQFYQQLADQAGDSKAKTSELTPANPNLAQTDDAILERLILLESKLAQELERKPKFQKPERQQCWREEISKLYSQLDKSQDRS